MASHSVSSDDTLLTNLARGGEAGSDELSRLLAALRDTSDAPSTREPMSTTDALRVITNARKAVSS